MRKVFVVFNCPSCNAPLKETEKTCPFCGVTLYRISDPLNNVDSEAAVKTCLENKQYELAKQKCVALINAGKASATLYMYLCIAKLAGKKPFVQGRSTIDECIDCLNAAESLNPSGVIYLLRAFIEYDYFERKYLNRNPNYSHYLECAKKCGYEESDAIYLEKLINTKIVIGGV